MNYFILIISTALGTFQLDKPNCQSETIQVYLKQSYVQNQKSGPNQLWKMNTYCVKTKFIAL